MVINAAEQKHLSTLVEKCASSVRGRDAAHAWFPLPSAVDPALTRSQPLWLISVKKYLTSWR